MKFSGDVLFYILNPHRPTKLLLEPAACKSLKILEVAQRRRNDGVRPLSYSQRRGHNDGVRPLSYSDQ